MNVFVVNLQYQGDDRVEDTYVAYAHTDDEDEVVGAVVDQPNFDILEQECIDNWAEEDDEDDDQWVSVVAELISEDELTPEMRKWLFTLPIILDERSSDEKFWTIEAYTPVKVLYRWSYQGDCPRSLIYSNEDILNKYLLGLADLSHNILDWNMLDTDEQDAYIQDFTSNIRYRTYEVDKLGNFALFHIS